ncbi:beta-lactamase domain [Fusarium agapanthi]|uniref:Beta-lactamase domain n=1 Tax=Fusarium agapanthi TaxID=1803897 RepID=A0A9P5B2J8_9HYPO|nr:beta-lactamase domain [Fusarium agapanthi]
MKADDSPPMARFTSILWINASRNKCIRLCSPCPPGFVNPFAAFDKFFFVGHAYVHAWAYDTGDGLVVIGALDNQGEIEKIMIPDLEKLGYKGSDIKHLIITHEHIDHFGGAKYIQDQFNASVYTTEAAWEDMAEQGKDGKTPVPGHTTGTLSLIFPVVDKGKRHMAGLSGSTGTPADKTSREQKITSQNRFAEISKKKGVDVLLSNHNVADHSLYNADILAHRAPGASNPYVVGVDNFYKYMRINTLCSQVIAARQGMDLDV